MTALQNYLFGGVEFAARFPLPRSVLALISAPVSVPATLRAVDRHRPVPARLPLLLNLEIIGLSCMALTGKAC